MRGAARLAIGVGTVAIVAVAGGVALAASTNPRPPSADRTSTEAYLGARLALVHAYVTNLPAGKAPMKALVAKESAECPGALSAAPVDARPPGSSKEGFTDQEVLLLESLQGLEIAQTSVDTAAVTTFASAIERLRWRDHRVTALVHALAQVEKERLQRRTPKVCAHIKTWAATGYRTLPESEAELGVPSERLQRELRALGCVPIQQPEDAVVAVLRRYQHAGEQPTTRQLEHAESSWRIASVLASMSANAEVERLLGAHYPPTERERSAHKRRHSSPPPYTACTGHPE